MDKPQTDKSQPKTAAKPAATTPTHNAPKDYRQLVRVANTDLDGGKPIYDALRKIKGVSWMYSNAMCHLLRIPRSKKAGDLTESDITKIEDMLTSPGKFNMPVWVRNRRKEYETGEDMHLITADLTYTIDNDIKRMKKIKSYKGVRHMLGQPVRGQRTKSNFRKNKGKISLGVVKKKTAAAADSDKK